MPFKVVIPARYGSTRLPAKALVDIAGKPMIQHVLERALTSQADEVLVATDDARIAAAVTDPRCSDPARPDGALAVMTRTDHQSGTDRIAEVAELRQWSDDTIVVNVQGDEPLLPPQLIDQVAEVLALDATADMATLCTPFHSLEEFLDTNTAKVVMRADGAALYFSRAPIPWDREGVVDGVQKTFAGAQRHIGLYAYRVSALRRLTALPPHALEVTEKLEQLRALAAGMRLLVATASVQPGMSIDTELDLLRVRATFENRAIRDEPRGS